MGKHSEAIVGVCSGCGESDPSKFSASRVGRKGGPCQACVSAYNFAAKSKLRGGPPRPKSTAVAGVCSKCGERDPSKFTPSALRRVGQWCRPCQAAYRRAADPDGNKRSERYRRIERKKRIGWLHELKAAGCVRCGEKDIACLDFHHTDERTKLLNIAGKIHQLSRAKIEAEIAKTTVLCSNCHRKLHYYEKSGTYARKKED